MTAMPSTFRELMPQPFALISIPARTRRDADTGRLITEFPAFSIARYPITNAQFDRFIRAGGYSTERWWTLDGEPWRAASQGTHRRYWDTTFPERLAAEDHPVVDVTWYEAMAFCYWLAEETRQHVLLPTAAMWRRAAVGDRALIYPWGDTWDGERCRHSGKPLDTLLTTPVTRYADNGGGDSVFGVSDLVGNVWEWCLDDADSGETDPEMTAARRLVLGGSWIDDDPAAFRIDNHFSAVPDEARANIGFRIAIHPPSDDGAPLRWDG
jgi:formylglycine-generating enzyme required for sulfatase activity